MLSSVLATIKTIVLALAKLHRESIDKTLDTLIDTADSLLSRFERNLTMERAKIEAYEIETSWDHSQYWQGAGLAFTDFDEIATGFGSSEMEAARDASEQLAMQGLDTSTIDISEANTDTASLCECGDDDDCEHGWFVTIRARVA